MSYSLLIDVVVALLLVVTIGYAVRLNKRLGALRRDKAELEKLASTFAESTIRADDSLGRLRQTADMMQQQIDRAQGLHDDLAFLLDRGEKAADRLEEVVRDSRDVDPHPKLAGNKATPSATPNPGRQTPPATSDGVSARPQEIDDINAGLHRPTPRVPPREEEQFGEQSDAERELLKALRSGN